MADTPQPTPLLQNERFVRYAIAKLLSLLGQNALMYGLFILIIQERESAFITSAFVLTAVIPSLALSLPGGVVADRLPKKITLLATLAVRIAIVVWFIQFESSITAVIALTLATWSVYQLFSPAESAALPAIVPQPQMGTASSVLNAVSLVAQVAGAGVVAPLAVKAFDADGLFYVVLALLVTSAVFFAVIPHLSSEQGARKAPPANFLRTLTQGFEFIRTHPDVRRVTILVLLLDSAALAAVVLAPTFINEVLRTSASNAIYIFMPGAVGVAVGLIVAPPLAKLMPTRLVVTIGFTLFVGVMLTLPFISEISRELDQRTFIPLQRAEDWLHVRREIAATVLLLPFGGLGISLVRVAARTAIYEHAPGEIIAQVFATVSMLGSVAALVPTLATGVLADLVDVRAAILLTGSIVAIVAIATIFRPLQTDPPAQPAGAPGGL